MHPATITTLLDNKQACHYRLTGIQFPNIAINRSMNGTHDLQPVTTKMRCQKKWNKTRPFEQIKYSSRKQSIETKLKHSSNKTKVQFRQTKYSSSTVVVKESLSANINAKVATSLTWVESLNIVLYRYPYKGRFGTFPLLAFLQLKHFAKLIRNIMKHLKTSMNLLLPTLYCRLGLPRFRIWVIF